MSMLSMQPQPERWFLSFLPCRRQPRRCFNESLVDAGAPADSIGAEVDGLAAGFHVHVMLVGHRGERCGQNLNLPGVRRGEFQPGCIAAGLLIEIQKADD